MILGKNTIIRKELFKAIEGLTDENLQILINEALEQFINWYRRNVLPR